MLQKYPKQDLSSVAYLPAFLLFQEPTQSLGQNDLSWRSKPTGKLKTSWFNFFHKLGTAKYFIHKNMFITSMRTGVGVCVWHDNNFLSSPIVAEIVHFYTIKQQSRMSPCWRYHLLPDFIGIQEGNRAGKKIQRFPWTEFHEKHLVLHFKSNPKQITSCAFAGRKKK